LVSLSSDKTEGLIKAGRLQEGQYYWLVKALGPDGREVATGRMNVLVLEYDNAVTDLRINSPRHGQRVSSSSIVVHGEIQLGARLAVNGRAVGVDDQGRFRTTVGLDKGNNRLVFRSLASDGVERFYVRDVQRR
jgi:hypothetical protein